ncbi:PEPxxWA-CTERM sorting domain-containing protein [Parasphingorhabdus sp.]|uniref:PEPxxWA-CTERM sorting domain-containing protein n=1 Tax=Parasphingorhabdus sp. TaxID=2709688 RepID=UPI0032646D4D
MKKLLLIAAAASVAAASAPAAAVVTLDFEGIGDNNPVGNFYAPEYVFSDATLALVDADAGGNGNFANEPTSDTVMFFLDANNAVLDVTNGFDTGFSFFYTSSTAATVSVWSGLGATGSLLGSIDLTAQHTDNCVGDPNGTFCNWDAIGIDFAGTAFSIDFGGTANFTAYDNITFGSATPGGAVPEPATWAFMIFGFGAIGGAMRRQRKANVKVSYA